jgi:hypothetical protein
MPNPEPWINQNEDIATNKFANHLLSIKAEHQKEYDLSYILHIMNIMKRL